MEQIDGKYLKGLMFTGATAKKVEVKGKKRIKWTPFERPMKAADVLSHVVRGDEIVIVGRDGKKHRVAK